MIHATRFPIRGAARLRRTRAFAAAAAILLSLFIELPAEAGSTFNVRSFGAAGDGIHDDSAAFRAALAAAARDQGTVVVPPGTYRIMPAAWVTIPSGVSMRGDKATILAGDYGFSLLGISGSRISVTGLTVDGAGKVVRGISVDSGSADVRLGRTTVENVAQPVDPSVRDFAANRFQVPAGVRIAGGGRDIVLDGVVVRHVRATNYDTAWPHPTARGIWISPGASEPSSRKITIENSTVADVRPKDDGDCLVIQGNPADTVDVGLRVLNNRFDSCAKRAIKIQLPGAIVRANVIDNPFLNDNAWTTYPPDQDNFDMYSAISVYASDVSVSGNRISGIGSFYNGIDVDAATSLRQVSITGNQVEMGPGSRVGAPSSLVGVLVPVSGLTIAGNTLDHATYGIRIDYPPTPGEIDDNEITNVVQAVYAPRGGVAGTD